MRDLSASGSPKGSPKGSPRRTAGAAAGRSPERPAYSVHRFRRPDGRVAFRAVAAYVEGGVKRTRAHNLRAATRRSAEYEAAAWYRRFSAALRVAGSTTLSAYARGVAEAAVESGGLSRATARVYASRVALVEAYFGDAPIFEVDKSMCEGFVSWLACDKGLSASTLRDRVAFLRRVTADALERHVIDEDPASRVRGPREVPGPPQVNYLTRIDRAELVSLLCAAPLDPLKVAASIALYTGLRRGEVCALLWGDWRREEGVIVVNKSATAKDRVKSTKTGRWRTVAVCDSLRRILETWYGRCLEPPEGEVLIAPGAYELAYPPSRLSSLWASFARENDVTGVTGQRARFHDLRHTWATAYLAAGGDVKSCQANLGHARASMTLDVYTAADADALAGVGRLAEGAIGSAPSSVRESAPTPVELLESRRDASWA